MEKKLLSYTAAKKMAKANVGLTYKEIEQITDSIYYKYYQGNCRVYENLVKDDEKTRSALKKDEKLLQELRFRDWCNSCLTYGMTYHFEPKELMKVGITLNTTLELYNITLERALEVIEQQKERFKTAVVVHNCYTDGEGCTYNSVKWD